MNSATPVDFVNFLAAHPDLMEAAPARPGRDEVDLRLQENRLCLHCGGAAQRLLLTRSRDGNHWLYLCEDCLTWLQQGLIVKLVPCASGCGALMPSNQPMCLWCALTESEG